ncbi:MAG: WxL domain-containing protein, partial [Streptococcaceae bacterium]|nr:WxL domain-containing protein [Streptococcaceae bacterium]
MKKMMSILLVFCFLGSCLIASTVFASDATSTFNLTAGDLTLDEIPSDFDYGSEIVGTDNMMSNISIAAGAIEVTDARGGDGNWEVTAEASDMLHSNGIYELPIYDFTLKFGAGGWAHIHDSGSAVVWSKTGALGTHISPAGESWLMMGNTSDSLAGTYSGTITFTL